ncbi:MULTISPECIES: M16 family metallopeptidase [Flavobacteriaceae]|uniref:M16 family metallopeptidase n=1 Tax=Flavobacteriaceae TaxID=49546 RepID=UPI001FE9BC36|nr:MULTISPECIES: M16 family metallopeptidase [Allomuricauda]MDC6366795.1 insulinase family protein [Muricauda sp. AC10]
MTKKFFISITLICFTIGMIAQDMNATLPWDNEVRKGVLTNGLTYYIQKTNVTQNAASYYIIQNVGSVLENDDQQGLAHFLEHMAFNGTKHFEGKGILNTLQKHGAVFGKDINAYTSFDETVYNVNDIPTTEALIDTCLLVLRDWADDLLLTDEEIEAERGVIQEEWRTRQSGRMRVLKQQLPVMFNHTKYADRMPIGTMDVVMNFDHKVLRDFYHDWYRTDLQAIAVIGDIDVDVIEQKIKKLFSNIEAIKNPKPRIEIDIPGNNEMLYVLAQDEEVTTSMISYGVSHPKKETRNSIGDFKIELLNDIITSLLSERLSELGQNNDAPFLNAYVGFGPNARKNDAFTMRIAPKPNKQKEAFKSVLDEVNRAYLHGFTPPEIERHILKIKNNYENQISKKGDRPHWQLAYEIQDDYLTNKKIRDIQKEYEIAKQLMSTLTAEELKQRLQALYTKNNRFLMVTGVENEENLSEEKALGIITMSDNNKSLEPYTENFEGKTLMSGIDIVSGKIAKEEEIKGIGTTFTLSNGVVVHYAYTDKEKNNVKLKAISNGGLSILKDVDWPSASFIGDVASQFGLGDYSTTDLQKLLAGKTAHTRVYVSDLTENIEGTSVTKDVETLLQMTYLNFQKPRFDKEAYEVFMDKVKNYLVMRSKDVNEKIRDSVTVTVYGKNNVKRPIFNKDYVDEISFENIKKLYLERFRDPSDFEFYIIGDITKEALKPLLEKYLASLSTYGINEKWVENEAKWVAPHINKDIYLKMEDPKSSVRIAYKKMFPYTLRNSYLAKALGDILTLRYTETLREQEGGTYGARSFVTILKRPVQKVIINVMFDCNPDKVDTLIDIVHQEIKKIANGEVLQDDLNKTLTNYLKEREQAKDKNQYTMDLVFNYFWEGYNMEDPENFDTIINGITIDDIANFAKGITEEADSFEIVIKPEK